MELLDFEAFASKIDEETFKEWMPGNIEEVMRLSITSKDGTVNVTPLASAILQIACSLSTNMLRAYHEWLSTQLAE